MRLQLGHPRPGLLAELYDFIEGGAVLAPQLRQQLTSGSDLGQALRIVFEGLGGGPGFAAQVGQLHLQG